MGDCEGRDRGPRVVVGTCEAGFDLFVPPPLQAIVDARDAIPGDNEAISLPTPRASPAGSAFVGIPPRCLDCPVSELDLVPLLGIQRVDDVGEQVELLVVDVRDQ